MKKLNLYTDGSIVDGNPGGNMGWAVVDGDTYKVVGCGRQAVAKENSSARAELMGILTALSLALVQVKTKEGILSAEDIEIFSDSQYAINILLKPWKAKANKDVIGDMRNLYNELPGITLTWIRGHDHNEGNIAADKAARSAAEGMLKKLDGIN